MSSASPDMDLLKQIESGSADRRILEFAVRGFLPLPPAELVRAVGSILSTGDAELARLAEETFRGFDQAALNGAVASPGIRPEQLDVIARRSNDPKVLEPLIRSKAVSDETLGWLAERIIPELQDVLVTNQARLLAAPVIVERLFENPSLSADIKRRADEFLEEFFLKKEREKEAEGAGEPAAPEEAPAAQEAAPSALAANAVVTEEDLQEEKFKSLLSRLQTMSVMERIKLAYGGNREERLFLVRDKNRLVATAVLKSPKTNEADAQSIATMKSVSEDVLRTIAMKREWVKKYPIMLTLVKNPRSPVDVTLPLVNRLTDKDQKALAGDKNVPEAIRTFARRAVSRRMA
ncbi:MAG: hypothetical protein IT186_09825 [Acidobacteria bacterium]|nr:hypothetical protein [Acidobacteriota bacterium]MCG3193272.1 hypothetical protein [Thermoanaerobaculia bacterium]MCK6684912.1 hypothetical protein [Thermoanaerobaculia bacterium]